MPRHCIQLFYLFLHSTVSSFLPLSSLALLRDDSLHLMICVSACSSHVSLLSEPSDGFKAEIWSHVHRIPILVNISKCLPSNHCPFHAILVSNDNEMYKTDAGRYNIDFTAICAVCAENRGHEGVIKTLYSLLRALI